MHTPILTTARLHLTPLTEAYAQDIFREFTTQVSKHMFPQPSSAIEDTLIYISTAQKDMDAGKEWDWVILRKDTDEFLGCAGLHKIHTLLPEPGIWIKESAHGHGFGKEAVHAIYHYACRHLHHIEAFEYPVAVENIASRKIPESLGGMPMQEKAEPRADGVMQQIVYYHIPLL